MALHALPGSGPRQVGRIAAMLAVAYWDSAELQAFNAMLAAPLGELLEAADRLRAVQEQRAAADLRLRRAECEAAGVRWLRVVGVRHD